ncbi:MAG: DNA-processing protein DprA [Alkalibacterium sp.]|uniref:DNA-processing protein DprA n=1 Tax=Alkalibacterium sp. TaxID=1872447 RepID=UPI00397062A2
MPIINTEEYLFKVAHCPFLSHHEKWKCVIDALPELSRFTHLRETGYLFTHAKKQKFNQYLHEFDILSVKEKYRKADLHTVSLESLNYPDALKNTYEPPILLFYKGDFSLLDRALIGMVGARDCTEYGDKVLDQLVPSIIDNNMVTVSGLARGIDTLVHTKTIENGGKTIAVIGNGIGYTYPKENKALQEEIGSHHLLISEYPLNTPPRKHHFPLRNRIIAGLSRGTVVVEAKERSGSLITARLALEEGRDVFAVPGSIFSEHSKGCLDLIKLGAISCRSAEDIYTEWNLDFVK